jgi:hypothetical protein
MNLRNCFLLRSLWSALPSLLRLVRTQAWQSALASAGRFIQQPTIRIHTTRRIMDRLFMWVPAGIGGTGGEFITRGISVAN